MSHKVPSPLFDLPVYTPDTIVELTSTGTFEPILAAPQRNLGKLGTVVQTSADGYCKTIFDPAQRDKFIGHMEVLETVGDSVLGATDMLQETSLPYCSEKVVPAADALLKHRDLLTELCPAAAAGVRWDPLATAVACAKTIALRQQFLERRLENLAILNAHVLTFIDDMVDTAVKMSASTIKGHRGLGMALEPATNLISGAAEQAQETKRTVARALKKQAQKAPAITLVKDAAAPATKDTATAAAKDKP